MTWSIIAHDPTTGAFGIAIATKFFAVGSLCPHAASGVGALSTQAMVNPLYGPRGLALLRAGIPADEVVRSLTAADEGRAQRQFHVIDAQRRIGQHTGAGCIDWCGHVAGDGFSVAGNMLAEPRVIEDTAAAYVANAGQPFAKRLIGALDAGDAAGGDKRGRQSAALLIYSGQDYPELDLRVDDHTAPLVELRRLLDVAHERFIPYLRCMASHERPAGIWNRQELEAEIARYTALPEGQRR